MRGAKRDATGVANKPPEAEAEGGELRSFHAEVMNWRRGTMRLKGSLGLLKPSGPSTYAGYRPTATNDS